MFEKLETILYIMLSYDFFPLLKFVDVFQQTPLLLFNGYLQILTCLSEGLDPDHNPNVYTTPTEG